MRQTYLENSLSESGDSGALRHEQIRRMSRAALPLLTDTDQGSLSPLHFGNHGDGSGEDGDGIDLHNTWRVMKHIHTYYNISLDPGKQVTQSKDNPARGSCAKES